MVEVKLDTKGVRELLKSKEVQNECMKYANSLLASVGDGYSVSTRNYPERSGAAVNATTYEAKKDNYDNNTLLRGLGAL